MTMTPPRMTESDDLYYVRKRLADPRRRVLKSDLNRLQEAREASAADDEGGVWTAKRVLRRLVDAVWIIRHAEAAVGPREARGCMIDTTAARSKSFTPLQMAMAEEASQWLVTYLQDCEKERQALAFYARAAALGFSEEAACKRAGISLRTNKFRRARAQKLLAERLNADGVAVR